MDLPDTLLRRPFSVREALDAGVDARTLRSPALATRWRGVRASPETEDHLDAACRAALLVAPTGSVVSHMTALRLHGLDLTEIDDREIHLTAPAGSTPSRRGGLRVHTRSARPELTRVRGLGVVTPALAWRQLAAGLDVDGLVVVGDALCRRRLPICAPADLAAAAAAEATGARGARRAREALSLIRAGTDSVMETRTRLVLVRARIPEPLVNIPVRDALDQFVALPDLQLPAARLAIEYDGDIHRTDPRTWRRDVERRQRLEDAGWIVVTATADDVLQHPERLIARVRRLLALRSAAR